MFKVSILLCLILINFSCSVKDKDIIICDAEKAETIDNKVFFVSGAHKFEKGLQQTDEHSFSGKHSVLVNQKKPFGFTFEIKKATPNESYEISVWRKGKGSLVISANTINVFYHKESVIKETKKALASV